MNALIGLTPARALLDTVTPLAERFGARRRRIHLVGGVVRDLLLGTEPADLDFTTDARPPEIKAALSGWVDDLWTQGERFGTIGARRGGTTFEITTYRAESYDPTSRKPEVRFGDSLLGDLERRDFTINAMAADLPDLTLVDPHGGQLDLAERRLRTPLSPVIAFDDDPLRMLRAARFAARFGLTVDPEVIEAMELRRSRLAIVSAERIHDELLGLLALADPVPGLVLLAETGLLDAIVPGAVVDAAVVRADDPRARLAVLVRDVDAPAVESMVSSLRFSSADAAAIRRAVSETDAVAALDGLDDRAAAAAVRRLVRSCRDDIGVVLETARALTPAGAARFDTVRGALGATEDLDDLGPGLDGRRVSELLGVEPGPVIGEAHRHLTEIRLDEGPLSEEELIERLLAWWADRSHPTG